MDKKYGPLAVLAMILVIAIAWSVYFQAAPPRILPKYFGIAQGSLESLIVLIILVVVVIAIGYAVSRKRNKTK
ncbi:MAG: hypothetical protein ABSA50_05465 [Candidatus Bathyarchaeia archaeon]|jgi:uncharacterized membrane protein